MKNHLLPYFSEIDLNSEEDYYKVDIDFEDHNIQLDINIESTPTSIAKLEIVKSIIENLAIYNDKSKKAITTDFKKGGDVRDYIEHHIEDIDNDELEAILKDHDKSLPVDEQLLSLMHLKRIGFYLDDEEQYAIFDYTIGREITQYVIVVKFDNNGNIEYLTMES
jgi:hypothetical protein